MLIHYLAEKVKYQSETEAEAEAETIVLVLEFLPPNPVTWLLNKQVVEEAFSYIT